MPLLKKAGRALSGKLTRVTLDRFLAAHASDRRSGQLLLTTRLLFPIHDAPQDYHVACRKPPA